MGGFVRCVMLPGLVNECKTLLAGMLAQIQHTKDHVGYPQLVTKFLKLRKNLLVSLEVVMLDVELLSANYEAYSTCDKFDMEFAKFTFAEDLRTLRQCSEKTRAMKMDI